MEITKLMGLLGTGGTTISLTPQYLTAPGTWYVAQQQGLGQQIGQLQGGVLPGLAQLQGLSQLSQQTMLAQPQASSLPAPPGSDVPYGEMIEAIVEKGSFNVQVMAQMPEIFLALLRQAFEAKGIRFDEKMGAPPTMADFRAQLLGHWTMEESRFAYRIRQSLPERKIIDDPVTIRDAMIEHYYTVEMTAAMKKLITALKAREDESILAG